jgi:tRNA A37 threonylcarbamoyladenosine synthetase subunit TsaC/SUA5/YrdC
MELMNYQKEYFRCVDRAAEVLAEGGIVLYPTDTVYGLGADS